MILWRICDVCSREFLCFDSIAGVFASCSGFSCRLKHAIDQHAQAPIEFRLPERFSKDWRIPVTLPQPRIAFGCFDQRECVRNPNGRAQYETSMSSDRILEFQSDNAVIFDHKNRENPLARAHPLLP